jgi:hypothetical protein
MSPREARQARNEAIFREVNERIAELADRGLDADFHIVCECAQTGCTMMLPIELDDYREIRTHPRRFVVAPDHVSPELEDVIDQQAAYQVVEKHTDVLLGVGEPAD